MTRDEAIRLIQTYFRSFGLQSPGLNEQNLGGAAFGDAEIYFEYQPEESALKCSALIYKFQIDPKAGVLEKLKEEELSADTGGGTIDYEPENRGLFLSRTYTEMVPPEEFTSDLERLLEASKVWSNEVLDRVASKIYHPEELSTAT
jgi:hypothetical protein